MYEPASGRFDGLDPYAGNSWDPQSFNKYLYTHADPVNNSDPTGEFSVAVSIAIGAGIGGTAGALILPHYGFSMATGALIGGAAGAATVGTGIYLASSSLLSLTALAAPTGVPFNFGFGLAGAGAAVMKTAMTRLLFTGAFQLGAKFAFEKYAMPMINELKHLQGALEDGPFGALNGAAAKVQKIVDEIYDAYDEYKSQFWTQQIVGQMGMIIGGINSVKGIVSLALSIAKFEEFTEVVSPAIYLAIKSQNANAFIGITAPEFHRKWDTYEGRIIYNLLSEIGSSDSHAAEQIKFMTRAVRAANSGDFIGAREWIRTFTGRLDDWGVYAQQ